MDLMSMLDGVLKQNGAPLVAGALIPDAKEEVLVNNAHVCEETVTAPKTVEIPPDMVYLYKGMRHKLVFEGVCSHCAHCGQPLTDSESVERGLGPICSKKGYLEEVTPVDDTEAFLALAEYPQLVEYLTAKYKPNGNRALCNGLVRTASLNRRTPVHAACTDAVEALGYKRLASALRESLSVVEIYDAPASSGFNDSVVVWVKKSEWSWEWTRDLRQIPGVVFPRHIKGVVVPSSRKRELWELVKKHYEGLCCKTKNGAVKIPSM
jgi:hypothetical protein